MKILFLASVMVIAATVPAVAQWNIVPIVDMSVRGIIGGVENGKWVAAPRVADAVRKGQKFNWFLPNGPEVKGLVAEKPEAAEPCDDFYSLRFDILSMGEMAEALPVGVAIGQNANWNPVPRKPAPIAEREAAKLYSSTVLSILRSNGMRTAKPQNIKAWRIDLEGDGVDEVLLESQTWTESITPSATAGDYSIIVLRKLVSGKVRDILVSSEFIKKSVEFGAPSRYKVSAIADLNGDGTMEFIVFGEYYEGGGSQAYQMSGSKVVEIKELQAACGV